MSWQGIASTLFAPPTLVFLGAAGLAAPAAAGTSDVTITNEGFAPQVLRIPVDTTVVWTNQEGVHTTTSTAGLWDSGVLGAGEQFSHAFDQVGVYGAYDTIHEWPSQTIEVVHSLAEIEVATAESVYAAGDTLAIGLALENPGEAVQVGIEVFGTTPVGTELPLLDLPSVLLPAGFAFDDASWATFLLPALPRGDYGVEARVVKVPEGDVITASSAAFTFGEARQTDWSGGPGAGAPVTAWGSAFDAASGASWRSIPGQLALGGQAVPPEAVVVADDAGIPSSVDAADLDGDGRDDLITTDPVYDPFAQLGAVHRWTQTPDGTWTQHVISDDFYGATYVAAADVDGDGDLDVPATAHFGDGPELGRNGKFVWFENDDGVGDAWTKHVLGDLFWGASHVDTGDVDGDGDADLVGASALTDGVSEQESDVTWFENLDGSGDAWGQHDLDLDFPRAGESHLADLDGDGDLDVVGANSNPFGASTFAWWENDAGDGSAWTKHVVPFEFFGQGYVGTGDVDLDGDVDLLGGGYNTETVGFWENLDGQGSSWIAFQIAVMPNGRGAELSDVDGDGDLDALLWSASWAQWIENLDGAGLAWDQRFLNTGLSRPWSALGDTNADGKLEVAVSSEGLSGEAELYRYEVGAFGGAGELVGEVLDGGPDPDWRSLEWDADVPRGTTLSVEVRAGDDPATLGPFVPVPASGASLLGLVDVDARYLQVRVVPASSDPAASPVLREVSVSFGDGF